MPGDIETSRQVPTPILSLSLIFCVPFEFPSYVLCVYAYVYMHIYIYAYAYTYVYTKNHTHIYFISSFSLPISLISLSLIILFLGSSVCDFYYGTFKSLS